MKVRRLAVVFAVMALVLFVVACESDDGGSKKKGDECEAGDVGGSYPVTITWEEETCNEDVVGDSTSGTMTIEQDGNKAKVYFQEFGSGSQRELVFEGKVCEYTITGSAEEDIELSEGVDCSSHRQSNYMLQLDPETQQLTGEFSGTYIWSGSDCEEFGITPNEQCSWKKTVGPYEP